MNYRCWYKLKLQTPDNAIKQDWKFPEISGNRGIWNIPVREIFSQTWLDYMSAQGIEVAGAMLFYRDRGLEPKGAHIDVAKAPQELSPVEYTTCAFNFVLGGEQSEMVWYQTPSDPKEIEFTTAQTPFLEWPIDELKEIDRIHIGKEIMVVRTNIPHTVQMGDSPRWCISVRAAENNKYTWEQIIETLKSKNLLIESN